MLKYRIIEKEDFDNNGQSKAKKYFIQKKILFWFNASIVFAYTLRRISGGSSGMMLEKVVVQFSSKEKAALYLEKYIKNPYKENYKGNKIIRIPNQYTWEDVYVNKSEIKEFYSTVPCYEASYELKTLKEAIDKRTSKTKISIVK